MDQGTTGRIAALTERQRERALGAVVAAAAGDALGAPYEFLAPIADSDDVEMTGGGVLDWEPGEWTDDTSLAIVVLEAAAAHPDHDLLADSAQDQIARDWYTWSLGTPDIGALTSTVMRKAAARALENGHQAPRAEDFRAAALSAHEELPLVAGNGALMRTYASVLPSLSRTDAEAVRTIDTICRLTHVHRDATEASILWGMAVRHAILSGKLDVRVGLKHLDAERAGAWLTRIEEAESAPPTTFRRNGWVVGAFQAAWSSIALQLPVPEGKFAQREMLSRVLENAVRTGYDTDTVACVAGALIGAALGPKAVPPEWRRALFGWPGYELTELVGLARRVLDPAQEV